MNQSDLKKFKQFLLKEVNSLNFQGILINYSDRSEVTYWEKEDSGCKKIILDFKGNQSIAFFCINGELVIL